MEADLRVGNGDRITAEYTHHQQRARELQHGLGGYGLTDVATLVAIENLYNFQPGKEVTVTVDTGDETDLVFLHAPFWRRPFTHLGSGVFERTWTVANDPSHPEWRRRAAVDVMSEGTLFDSEEPYDSSAWVVPYYVGGLTTP